MAEVGAVIVAAGRSSRMGGPTPKQYRLLAGRPVLAHTLRVFEDAPEISFVVLVVPPGDEARVRRMIVEGYGFRKCLSVVPGGAERQESVRAGLSALPPCDVVLIHDGVRPFVPGERLAGLIEAALAAGAATLAVPPKDTVKMARMPGLSRTTLPRDRLWLVQTPQAFRLEVIINAHKEAAQKGFVGTDDTALVEMSGGEVALVPGDYTNIKLTTPEDFVFAEAMMGRMTGMRSGFGYDVHRLAEGRKLVLGGVEVPYEKGLLGHSDADVLAHAVMDALLGAAALGDIGRHFPDSDPAYQGISSLELLKRVVGLLERAGFAVVNVDATVVAQAPRLAPFIPLMRENMARVLGVDVAVVSVKATTTEGLGFTGGGEGMAAYAVAGISRRMQQHWALSAER
ncbi:MAG: 2-C-methyl-D-erythritol 4-phosphate cytidylyltransferase [Bacillota bacterium]